MPYRLNPKNKKQVQVYKNGGWRVVKTHKTPSKARGHLSQLKRNVRHK